MTGTSGDGIVVEGLVLHHPRREPRELRRAAPVRKDRQGHQAGRHDGLVAHEQHRRPQHELRDLPPRRSDAQPAAGQRQLQQRLRLPEGRLGDPRLQLVRQHDLVQPLLRRTRTPASRSTRGTTTSSSTTSPTTTATTASTTSARPASASSATPSTTTSQPASTSRGTRPAQRSRTTSRRQRHREPPHAQQHPRGVGLDVRNDAGPRPGLPDDARHDVDLELRQLHAR